MSNRGCYVYAVARGLSQEHVKDLTGLRSAPLRVVEHRGLAAIISSVELEEFGDLGLRRNLEDLTWLEGVARTHDAVVRSIGGVAASAPLRLATICLNEDRVRSLLDEWHDAILAALKRVEGRLEWSVKVIAEDMGSLGLRPPATAKESATVGVGAAYLKRRKEENAQREDALATARTLADEVHALLSSYAVASRRLPPQDPRISGYEGAMTLNAAYLVENQVFEEFQAVIRELKETNPGLRIEAQGPWPPYSFSTLEGS
jgi:Gas vesicle synthesis protein GvpL/GvpF